MINLSPKYLNYILVSLPNILWPLKRYLIKKSLKKAGKNFRFGINSRFSDHRLIAVGDHVFMGMDTVINTTVPVVIGSDVMFGPGVTIMGGDHNISEVGKRMRDVKTGGKNIPIIIEDDVWISVNVTILKGVNISEGTVIGAGSIVTKSLPPYSVCMGNPCKSKKLRFSDEDLSEHLNLVNSKYTVERIHQLFNEQS
jgi:acetyltransferase-like isoleucine patch superfamily enzyme